MSITQEVKMSPDEQKLGVALVRRKLLTDSQLRAAMDYQRSLGGKLSEVLVKLGLLRSAQVEEVLRNVEGGDGPGDSRLVEGVIDPATVKVAELKVHRKLLEKIPQDFQERFLLVPFFPRSNGDSRKIVMGHGREIAAEFLAKVSAILGVELCTLALEEKLARELGGGESRTEGRRSAPAPSRAEAKPETKPETRESPALTSSDQVLNALLTLLIRKGLISREELETELTLIAGGRRQS